MRTLPPPGRSWGARASSPARPGEIGTGWGWGDPGRNETDPAKEVPGPRWKSQGRCQGPGRAVPAGERVRCPRGRAGSPEPAGLSQRRGAGGEAPQPWLGKPTGRIFLCKGCCSLKESLPRSLRTLVPLAVGRRGLSVTSQCEQLKGMNCREARHLRCSGIYNPRQLLPSGTRDVRVRVRVCVCARECVSV